MGNVIFGLDVVVSAMTLSGGGDVDVASGRGLAMAREEQAALSERQAQSTAEKASSVLAFILSSTSFAVGGGAWREVLQMGERQVSGKQFCVSCVFAFFVLF